jgi:transposase
MIDLLREMKEAVDKYRQSDRNELSVYYTQKFSQEYGLLIKEGMGQNQAAPKVAGQRGRTKQSKARLLLERLNTLKDDNLRFTTDFSVPFDNNQAERNFRLSKVKQKVSGCFRSDTGAQAFATVQSFIQTINKHHLSICINLVNVFHGNYSLPFALIATE